MITTNVIQAPEWRADEPAPAPEPAVWDRGVWVGAALAAVGVAVFFGSLGHVDLNGMTGLGLISVLPVASLIGVVAVAVGFVVVVSRPRPNWPVLGAILVGLVFCLDGVTAFVEPEPRFATAYQIAGFVDFVSRTGHVAPNLDAYFNWPGFFALISLVTGAAGTHGILGMVKFWPLMIDLMYLPALLLLYRNLRVSWRAQWLGMFLFVLGNWVGQDYFSPQAFNYLLYLVFVAILLNWFVGGPGAVVEAAHPRSPLRRLHRRVFGILTPGERPARPLPTSARAFLVLLLIAIFTVSTVSHQLTPFFMIVVCGGLVVIRRSTLTTLPVLLGVLLAGFVSFATVEYWTGHLTDVFGAFGHLGANLSSSVGNRVTGSSPSHVPVLHAREAVPGLIVIMAVGGLLRRRRQGYDDRVLLLLLCSPALMIAMQSYGGEIGLRIYLFMLPAASLGAACFLYPGAEPAGRNPLRLIAKLGLTALAVVLPVVFFVARYGNEAFEQTPPGELAAANWIYAHDTGGLRLLWMSPAPINANTPTMPWSYQDIAQVEYIPVQSPVNPNDDGGVVADLRSAGPGSYLVLTQTLDAALEQTVSYPATWDPGIRAALARDPDIEIAYSNATAIIYTYRWPPGTPRVPVRLTGGQVRYVESWTRAGIVVMWLLLGLLLAREMILLWNPASRLVRRLAVASVPLLLLLVADVLFRFATIR